MLLTTRGVMFWKTSIDIGLVKRFRVSITCRHVPMTDNVRGEGVEGRVLFISFGHVSARVICTADFSRIGFRPPSTTTARSIRARHAVTNRQTDWSRRKGTRAAPGEWRGGHISFSGRRDVYTANRVIQMSYVHRIPIHRILRHLSARPTSPRGRPSFHATDASRSLKCCP